MSNLIPTPRVDKNGRTVIRHMSESSDSALARANNLPGPTIITPTSSHERKVNRLSFLFERLLSLSEGDERGQEYAAQAQATFSNFSEHTVDTFIGFVENGNYETDGLFELCCAIELMRANAPEIAYNDFSELYPELTDWGIEAPNDVVEMTASIGHYADYIDPYEAGSPDYSDARVYQAKLLTSVAFLANDAAESKASKLNDEQKQEIRNTYEMRAVVDGVPEFPVLKDPALIRTLVENADRVDDILQFVEDRDAYNPQLILEFLNSPTAVSSGVL